MHDKAFRAPSSATRASLDALAKALGLDAAKWKAHLDGETHAPAIEADMKAASEASIQETPAYLVVRRGANRGTFVDATEESEKLHRAIERALREDAEREDESAAD
jgi:predicted DsbA family dithiol-disulfide isomerase